MFFLAVLALTKPMGAFMARVFEGERTWLHPLLRPLERLICRLCGIQEDQEQRWTGYAGSLLMFSLVSLLLTYLVQRIQGFLPFNPQGFGTAHAAQGATAMTPDLAFNTAVSFTTNTNWQGYTPETTMSYLTQMLGLATHNFFSAAAGMAIAIALVRGFARHSSEKIGNFWVDLVRATVYVLLPLSVVIALFFVSQGVIQNLSPYTNVTTLEGGKQTIAQGPVASQEAIKMLGTNGGGFFNANSAHPFENPTPLSNFIQLLSIFVIPAGLTYTFGKMVKDTRQGWALFAAMSILFLAGVVVSYSAEQYGNPILTALGIESHPTATQPGGNMEGKEVRFGIANSALFATVTTDASCGAVNSMHDSFTPLGGLVPLVNIELGEVVFGGVGAGLYGMLMFAILAVFIAGLMVGRTPEYLGKKIEQKEVKMVMLAVLVLAASILLFSGTGAVIHFANNSWINPPGAATGNLGNHGPHGLSEILYAYSSATGNNGSAFGGITSNTPWYNLTMGLAMLIGRFLMIIPLLAVAGSLAQKKLVPASAGTLPTNGALFVGLLVGVVLIVGALTFFPALTLGPVVEHFLMLRRQLFSFLVLAVWS
jgi:potassium-transporting ATPase potassium-binding subunit